MDNFFCCLGMITQLGISIFINIFVGLSIGRFLDNRFHTAPVFLIVFIFMGVISAFKSIFLIAKKYFK